MSEETLESDYQRIVCVMRVHGYENVVHALDRLVIEETDALLQGATGARRTATARIAAENFYAKELFKHIREPRVLHPEDVLFRPRTTGAWAIAALLRRNHYVMIALGQSLAPFVVLSLRANPGRCVVSIEASRATKHQRAIASLQLRYKARLLADALNGS